MKHLNFKVHINFSIVGLFVINNYSSFCYTDRYIVQTVNYLSIFYMKNCMLILLTETVFREKQNTHFFLEN